MDYSFDIDKGLKRIRSVSTIYSEPLTFHSLPNTSPRPLVSETAAWIESGLLRRERSDSGYSDPTMDMAEVEKNVGALAYDLSAPTLLETTMKESATFLVLTDDKEAVSVPNRQLSRIPIQRAATTPLPESTIIRKISSRRSSTSGPSSQRFGDISQTSIAKRPQNYLLGSRSRSKPMMRSSTSISARQYFEDPYIVHHRARQLFECLTPTTVTSEPHEALLPCTDLASLSVLPRRRTMDSSSSHEPLSPRVETEPPCTHALSTVIDWTAPATRRREYDKIDRSTRGLRGLWLKITPSWFRAGGRMRFYEGKDDDGGSVRRYRLDLSDEVDEKGKRSSGAARIRSWNCFTTKGFRK